MLVMLCYDVFRRKTLRMMTSIEMIIEKVSEEEFSLGNLLSASPPPHFSPDLRKATIRTHSNSQASEPYEMRDFTVLHYIHTAFKRDGCLIWRLTPHPHMATTQAAASSFRFPGQRSNEGCQG
jgi:hypothetical protein